MYLRFRAGWALSLRAVIPGAVGSEKDRGGRLVVGGRYATTRVIVIPKLLLHHFQARWCWHRSSEIPWPQKKLSAARLWLGELLVRGLVPAGWPMGRRYGWSPRQLSSARALLQARRTAAPHGQRRAPSQRGKLRAGSPTTPLKSAGQLGVRPRRLHTYIAPNLLQPNLNVYQYNPSLLPPGWRYSLRPIIKQSNCRAR